VNDGQAHLDYNIDFPPPPDFESPNCASTDPEIFFPKSAREIAEGEWPKEKELQYRVHQPRGKALKATEVARAICMDCLHLSPCRNYAVVNRVQFGIWGGTTYRDRLLLAKLMGIGEVDGETA
jgi:Transcription factor WhiB